MNKGSIIMWVLVFGTVFLIMLSGILGFLIFQIKENQRAEARNLAFHIAEAGINYSRWHLAHSPEDFDFDNTYDYKDPEGQIIGQYQLTIFAPSGCQPGITIKSSGWKQGFENEQREIQAIYAKPALAKYAFLTNANVWFGPDEELKGPFHSNAGIRMDGEQNSLSSSAKQTYICGPEHGCSPSQEKPGIWGDGDGQEQGLWQFPVSNVDFDAITQDMAVLKQLAQDNGIYLGSSDEQGYHLQFKSNETFDVFKVNSLKPAVWGHNGNEWVYESNSINSESFYQNFSLPSNCAPIFIEDNVWVDGDILGRATVVAAELPEMPGSLKKIIIPDNINYLNQDSALGLIAQKDILIPLYSPDNLEIKAALIAQQGHVFRYYYPRWWYEPYYTYAIRGYIETYGSLVTNTIWTFTWVNSSMDVVSGYQETEMNYNPDLTYSPPPHFPVTGDYQIAAWEEID